MKSSKKKHKNNDVMKNAGFYLFYLYDSFAHRGDSRGPFFFYVKSIFLYNNFPLRGV